jgi:hypothetical protein
MLEDRDGWRFGMKRILAVLLLTACHKTTAAPTASKPTREEFSKLALSHAPSGTRYDATKFALVLAPDGGDVSMFFLDNFYGEYCAADPSAREDTWTRLFAQTPAARVTFEESRSHLLPLVREGLYFDIAQLTLRDMSDIVQLRLRRDGPKPSVLHHPITSFFHEALAIDGDKTITQVTDAYTKDWKKSWEELREVAMANLAARSKEDFVQVKPGLWRSPWHDNYDASRILLTKKIAALPVHGAPIAMVPNRDTLLVAGDKDAAALLAMADLAKQIMDEPRAMMSCALRLDGDKWSEYLPDVTPEVKARFRMQQLSAMMGLYGSQKKALDEDFAARHEDLFVATYMAFAKPGAEPFSVSTLSRGTHMLLPVTERVMFIDAKEVVRDKSDTKPLGWAPWERVMKVFGKSMKPMGMSPERYRIDEFPTSEQLKALALTPQ